MRISNDEKMCKKEGYHKYAAILILTYTGWQRNNGTVDTVDFQDFALTNNNLLHFVG